MIAGLLLYVAAGLLALLLPEYLISPADIVAERQFLAITTGQIVFLLAMWIGATWCWLSQVASEEARGRPPDVLAWRLIIGSLTVLAMVAAWTKPVLSIDPLYYIAYGRQITAYGLNPYQVNLWASAKDPIISQISTMWFHNIAFYGPVALTLYSLANLIVVKPTLFALASAVKFLWVPFYALLGWVVWKLAGPGKRYRATITLAVLANPLLLWFSLVDGHVDLLVVVMLLLAALAASGSRPVCAALAMAVAGSIKIVGIIAVPVLFCYFLRSSARMAGIFGLTFGLVYGGEYALARGGEFLGVIGFTKAWNNLEAAALFPRLFDLLGVTDLGTVGQLSNLVFYLTTAAVCVATWRTRLGANPCLPMALAMAALFMSRTYYQPWYTMWFWPLLWFASDRPAHTLRSIVLWTVCVTAAWLLPWSSKIWLISAGVILSLVSALRDSKCNMDSTRLSPRSNSVPSDSARVSL